MKLLLLSAIRSSKHLLLAITALVLLICLTMANQTERCALGMMANNGTDFFKLFSDGKSSNVSKADIENRWSQIDENKTDSITKIDAAKYLAKNDTNPLGRLLQKLSINFDIEKNFFSLIIFLVIIAAVKAVTMFFSNYATNVLSIRVSRDLREQYFEHIQSLPLGFFHKYNLGTLTSRAVGDAGQIASSLNSLLLNYIQTPFTIITSLVACFFISWKLSMIIFFGLPLIIIPIVLLTKRVKRVARQLQRNQENFTSILLDFLSGIQTVKIFSMEKFALKKYKYQNDDMARLECKNAKYSILTRPILHTITTTCLIVVVMFGLYFLQMTIAQLIVFCAVLHLFYEPVKKFADENANIQRGIVAAERMFEVMHLKPQIQDKDGALELKSFNDKIEFKNISFKYNDEWIIKDLSFSVKKGQTLAIVGPTGAGKSTIVQLLPRLYDIQSGEILIDGVSIKDYTQKSLRENISFVPQKPFLFCDTVSENISFGKGFSKDEIIQAAKKAHAHEFIVNLPGTYNASVLETGKNLSGGQQQRLAIARALIKKAPILILDEATSALDALSEDKIKLALQGQQRHTTQILIAHRLSTIEHADVIIYLDRGRKVAQGTKEELLKSSQDFKLMWESFHKTKKPPSISEKQMT
jgi:ABC-type multidrug transport system fused ATPase/permease subunit